jgi:hypothetical protein
MVIIVWKLPGGDKTGCRRAGRIQKTGNGQEKASGRCGDWRHLPFTIRRGWRIIENGNVKLVHS